MMVVGLPILLTALGGTVPDVRGAGDCPSADEVAAHLRPLLPQGAERVPDAWLELAVTPPSGKTLARQIDVRMLTSAKATPIASRRLDVAGSCAEAAEAVAVVAASWMADYSTPPAPSHWNDGRVAAFRASDGTLVWSRVDTD